MFFSNDTGLDCHKHVWSTILGDKTLCIISAHPSFFLKYLLFQMGGDSAVGFMTEFVSTCLVFSATLLKPKKKCRANPRGGWNTSGSGYLYRHHSWTSVHKNDNLPKSFRKSSSNGPVEFQHFGSPWCIWFCGFSMVPPCFIRSFRNVWSSKLWGLTTVQPSTQAANTP